MPGIASGMLPPKSGGKRYFIVPWPGKSKPEEVQHYESAAWAAGHISLLEYLRKTNKQGDIAGWLKRLHNAIPPEADKPTLEDFAVNFVMKGQQLVSADMLSRMNDRWYGQWLVLNVPFLNMDELMQKDIIDRVPAAYVHFAHVMQCEHPLARTLWEDETAIEMDLKREAHTREHISTILHMVKSHKSLVNDYLTGKFDTKAEEEKMTSAGGATSASGVVAEPLVWHAKQERFKARVDKTVDLILEMNDTDDEDRKEEIRDELQDWSKICICTGAPGTGKTTVVHACIERVLEKEGEVLFALPKAQLVSRMRERYGTRIDIDTCHAAFGFNEEETQMPALAQYTLIVVDELSQLEAWQFERIVRAWNYMDHEVAIAMVGDKWQMPGYGDHRPWHSALWKSVTHRVDLHQAFRCKDPTFWNVLSQLRTTQPDSSSMQYIRERAAWKSMTEPTVEKMRILMKSKPNTTILTVSRFGAAEINDYILQALFPKYPAKVWIDADMECNPDNYERGELKQNKELKPSRMPVYVGMYVYMTRNVRKDVDYVNGMRGTVESWDAKGKALRVVTSTGHRIAIFPWTDTDHGNLVYYPVRPGYASTIGKFQGAELPHVTLYLDAKGVPAAGYTGLSRVATGNDFSIIGRVTRDHFVPARE
eukprot:6469387-Amphidinium_carterae.2